MGRARYGLRARRQASHSLVSHREGKADRVPIHDRTKDPNRLLIPFHRKDVASERRLGDVIDQFDRQSEVLPRVKWFADADRARELLAFAGLQAGERVLEVGCGPGIVLEHARNTANLLAGVDVSPRMLAEAARRAPKAHLMQAMGERLPLREAAFDLVYSRSVLHHVLSPARMVDEMARVVRRGGRSCETQAMDEWFRPRNCSGSSGMPGFASPRSAHGGTRGTSQNGLTSRARRNGRARRSSGCSKRGRRSTARVFTFARRMAASGSTTRSGRSSRSSPKRQAWRGRRNV